jgi:hypothetical protein
LNIELKNLDDRIIKIEHPRYVDDKIIRTILDDRIIKIEHPRYVDDKIIRTILDDRIIKII